MDKAEQAAKAEAFRALHRAPPLLLMANAWDAVSARIIWASASPSPGAVAAAEATSHSPSHPARPASANRLTSPPLRRA